MNTTKIKFLLLTFGVVALTISLTALTFPNETKDTLMMKTIESHSMVNIPCGIFISKSDGTTNSFELQRYSKNMEKAMLNTKTIHAKISEIESMGYELKKFSGGGGVEGTVYTYLFEKK